MKESEGLYLHHWRVEKPEDQACVSAPQKQKPGDDHMFRDPQNDRTAVVVALPVVKQDTTQYLVLFQSQQVVDYHLFVEYTSTTGFRLGKKEANGYL